MESTILQHCKDAYVPLKALTADFPKSTLYRSVRKLVERGLLTKSGDMYRATEEGLRQLGCDAPGELSNNTESKEPGRQKIQLCQQGDMRMSGAGNVMPNFTLDEQAKQQLVWFAEEAQTDLNMGIEILMDYYKLWKRNGKRLRDLHNIVQLYKQSQESEVDIADLKSYLRHRAELKKHGLSLQDAPEVLEVAKSMREAQLSFQDAKEFLKICHSLKKVGIELTDLKQLKQDIDGVHKLVGVPKTEVQELASCLDEIASLREELAPLQRMVREQEKRLEHIRKEAAELGNCKKNLDADCTQLRQQITEGSKQLAAIRQEASNREAEIRKYVHVIHYTIGLQEFLLSRDVSQYDGFWRQLDKVLQVKREQNSWSAPVPPKLSEAVRSEIIRILKKIVEEDLVNKNDLKEWRRKERIAAAEMLCKEFSTLVEGMQNAHDAVKKLESDVDKFLDKVRFPVLHC
jgi:chromosome segregation ATPase